MENLLLLVPLLACPVGMALIGAGAWAWAKLRRRGAEGGSPALPARAEGG